MASNFKDKQCLHYTAIVSTTGTFTAANVDIVNDVVTLASHGLSNGDPIGVVGSGVPTGLTSDTTAYYTIVVDSNTIAFATSLANAQAGTKIDLTAVGSSTTTVYKNAIGNITLGIIPKNFIITGGAIDSITSPTASATSATLALTVVSSTPTTYTLVTAIAISNGVWDAGVHGILAGNYAEATVAGDTAVLAAARQSASWLKPDAPATLRLVGAVKTLTAGKWDFYIEGYQSES